MARQIAVREGWLARRYQMLLPMMRAHKVGMWVVVNEEFHDDPLTPLVAPPRPYVGRRDVFVFIDGGEAGLVRVAATGYAEENIQRFFSSPDEPAPAEKVLAALTARYQPATIALGAGGSRGVTRSLTHDTWQFIVEAIGPEMARRIVPAEPLIEQFLDTRIPEEMPHYTLLVEWTEHLGRRALSNEVITPGVTTVGDVRRWLYTQSHAAGFVPWFQPDLRVQRRSAANASSRGFLAVAKENVVIEPGDVVHLDFGLTYMGLSSDWQKMAYVLREGESDVPDGLKRAMANTNALQDSLARLSKPGKPAGDVHTEVMAEMQANGITAQIYSHPLGNQGHGLGPSIDMRSARREPAVPPKPLRRGAYLAMELNTQTPVPEWNGQPVTIMAEDPVHLTDDGWQFFRPRQQSFYVIRPVAARAAVASLADGLYAELRTNKGPIVLRLDTRAPLAVASFIGLAEGTVDNSAVPPGAPFFDGTVFHRVVPGHVIQAGAALAGTTGPGYSFPNEIVPGLSHGRAGMLGMANAGPHTNGSQFYITLGDRSYLDGNYTLLGEVVQGMDVVRSIVQGDWIDHVRILRVGEDAKAFRADTASFRAAMDEAKARVKSADAEKRRREEAAVAKSWPRAKTSAKGARYVVRRTGSGLPAAESQTIVVRYTGWFLLAGDRIASSAPGGRPVPGTVGESFEYVPGKTRLTPALEEALAGMRKGERRTVIAIGDLAYGRSGYTAPETPGQKRFVISPNTALVYDVEVLDIVR